ncbi:MAG: flagellar biosynthesis anti-sigma factor FlgM [Nitrospinaceae bacterium]
MEIPGNEFRIRNRTVQDKPDAAAKRVSAEKAKSSPAASGDNIAISSKAVGKAQDIELAHKAIQAVPETRAEKVSSLKADYEAGRLSYPADDVAEALLREIINESQFQG